MHTKKNLLLIIVCLAVVQNMDAGWRDQLAWMRSFFGPIKKPSLINRQMVFVGTVGALAFAGGVWGYKKWRQRKGPSSQNQAVPGAPAPQQIQVDKEEAEIKNQRQANIAFQEQIEKTEERVIKEEQALKQKESNLKEQLKEKEDLLEELREERQKTEELNKQLADTNIKDDKQEKIDNPEAEKGEEQQREQVKFELWDVVKRIKSEKPFPTFKNGHLGIVTQVNEKQKQITVDFIYDDLNQEPKQLVTIKNHPQEFFEKVEMKQGQNETVSLYQEVVLKVKTYQGDTVPTIGRVVKDNNDNSIIVRCGLNSRSLNLREVKVKKTDVYVEENAQQPRPQSQKTSQKKSQKTFEEKVSIFRSHLEGYKKNNDKKTKERLLQMIEKLLKEKEIAENLKNELYAIRDQLTGQKAGEKKEQTLTVDQAMNIFRGRLAGYRAEKDDQLKNESRKVLLEMIKRLLKTKGISSDMEYELTDIMLELTL